MNFLSVCSGIDAASVAWHPLGWKPVAFSEIEAFPSAVLAHHYPDVPNLGDMTNFKEWPDYGSVGLLCGGTPCQSYSVAGLGDGLNDPRGDLMLTFLAVARRYGVRWVVWEQVPGVLSTNGGRDFGTLLSGMGQLGYGWAYRILDAQYIRVDGYARAVPQRRRRVVLVGYLGDWRPPAAVLFEPKSLLGTSPPRRQKGQAVAALTASGVGTCGGDDNQAQAGHLIADHSVAATLEASYGRLQGCSGQDMNHGHSHLVPQAFGGNNQAGSIDVSTTIQAHANRTDFESETFVVDVPDTAATLTRGAESSGKGGSAGRRQEDDTNIVAFAQNQRDEIRTLSVAGALPAIRRGDAKNETLLANDVFVRRLTPRECERLQGYPDDYTLITYRGKPAKDTPRYKAIGNSWSINKFRWVGRRIQIVKNIIQELRA